MTRAAGSAASPRKARILVVDDHPMVRNGLSRLIGQQSDLVCCGEAETAAEAHMAVSRLQPDLLLLDLRLREADGLELTKALKARFPSLPILILSQFDETLYIEKALRCGAVGYVAKHQPAEEILTAIRTVLAGDLYITRGMAALLLHRFVVRGPQGPPTGVEPLTERELHVLQLLGAGLSTRQTAEELKLSFKTVETHRENIKRKLGLRGAAALVHFATEWGREQISVASETLAEANLQAEGAE